MALLESVSSSVTFAFCFIRLYTVCISPMLALKHTCIEVTLERGDLVTVFTRLRLMH